MEFSFSQATRFLSGTEILINVLASFLLGVYVAIIYRTTARSRAPSITLTHTLVMLAMVTSLVMMAIGDSIARAFSLVGALSIIRFRTVVKDNRDTAFVFLALAAGMACGAGSYRVAVVGVLAIGALVLLIFVVQFGRGGTVDYLLKLQVEPDDGGSSVYQPVFDNYLRESSVLSIRSLRLGQLVEMTYQVRFKRGVDQRAFVSELGTTAGVDRVSLITAEEDAEG